MQEKVLNNRKNGMLFMLLFIALYLLAVLGMIAGIGAYPTVLTAISIVWLVIGWIPLCGLKVLKPQEALVLTLFGKYHGTLKGDLSLIHI